LYERHLHQDHIKDLLIIGPCIHSYYTHRGREDWFSPLTMSATDDTDTTDRPLNSSYTWVQLYRDDQAVGLPTVITDPVACVSILTKLVKAERAVALQHCDGADLVVYPPGTPLDGLNDDHRLDPGEAVPGGTTSKKPLIVMAPAAAAAAVTQLGKCL
jgi:hypothetical protein